MSTRSSTPSSPREFAVTLQRHARTLQALADQWSTTEPSTRAVLSPYEGAEDLNSPAALQLDGVLFLEGEGRPAEISHLIRDLRNAAEDQRATGEWLATAMESSWAVAAALVEIDGLADMLGERHRIIANDWQAAAMNTRDEPPARPGRRHPRARRLHPGRAACRPRRRAGLRRPALLRGRDDLPRRRPVQRLRRPRPRQRTPVADLPPPRRPGPRRPRSALTPKTAEAPEMEDEGSDEVMASVLDAAEAASPVEAVESVTRELGPGARRHVGVLPHRRPVGAGPGAAGARPALSPEERRTAGAAGDRERRDDEESATVLPFDGGPEEQAVRTQEVQVLPPGRRAHGPGRRTSGGCWPR